MVAVFFFNQKLVKRQKRTLFLAKLYRKGHAHLSLSKILKLFILLLHRKARAYVIGLLVKKYGLAASRKICLNLSSAKTGSVRFSNSEQPDQGKV